jgi:hypothetical protein
MPTGSIYTLRSKSCPTLIYVGSTIQSLAVRKGGHWRDFKKWKEGGCFITSFRVLEIAHALGDRNDCYIELIRNVTFTDKAELLREEGIEMRKIECVNKCIAGRTPSEYRVEHHEEINDYGCKYRVEHRNDKKELNRVYNAIHRDEINANARERVPCVCCNINVPRGDLSKHKKSFKHIENLKETSQGK